VVDKLIMTKPINHIVEADIKGFFDNVSHEWMMRGLRVRVKDPSFLLLIQRFLKAGYMEGGEFVETEKGTPQGGNLSPMLSNIFLHYVLDLWFERKIRPQLRGESYLVRYADDCAPRGCTKDEGGPLGTGLQGQVPNHLKLHW
jgi:retron-type reverse transcriptase